MDHEFRWLYGILCVTMAVIAIAMLISNGCTVKGDQQELEFIEDDGIVLQWEPCKSHPEMDKFRVIAYETDSCESLRGGLYPMCSEKIKDYKILCLKVGEREQCWSAEFFLQQMGCE